MANSRIGENGMTERQKLVSETYQKVCDQFIGLIEENPIVRIFSDLGLLKDKVAELVALEHFENLEKTATAEELERIIWFSEKDYPEVRRHNRLCELRDKLKAQ